MATLNQKREIAKNIGDCFWGYSEKNGKYCIDNGEKVMKYDSVDALLEDWLWTIIEQQISIDACYRVENDCYESCYAWEDEITFIYEEIIGHYPPGITCMENYNKTNKRAWGATHYYNGGTYILGVFPSITDAIDALKMGEAYKKQAVSDEEMAQLMGELVDKGNNLLEAAGII